MLKSKQFNPFGMLDLEFWYLFFGVFYIVYGLFMVFQPGEVKKLMKALARRISTMRMMGGFLIFLGVLLWYSSAFRDGIEALILHVVAYLALIKALGLIFLPRWTRKTFMKKVMHWADPAFIVMGVITLGIGVASLLYGALYV